MEVLFDDFINELVMAGNTMPVPHIQDAKHLFLFGDPSDRAKALLLLNSVKPLLGNNGEVWGAYKNLLSGAVKTMMGEINKTNQKKPSSLGALSLLVSPMALLMDFILLYNEVSGEELDPMEEVSLPLNSAVMTLMEIPSEKAMREAAKAMARDITEAITATAKSNPDFLSWERFLINNLIQNVSAIASKSYKETPEEKLETTKVPGEAPVAEPAPTPTTPKPAAPKPAPKATTTTAAPKTTTTKPKPPAETAPETTAEKPEASPQQPALTSGAKAKTTEPGKTPKGKQKTSERIELQHARAAIALQELKKKLAMHVIDRTA